MAYSLLAYLFPRIKGSQEDIATYSLGYLLGQSSVLNEAFTRLIAETLQVPLEELLAYNCQDADEQYGRPDIAGYENGILKVLCEAKFFAGLTENQPVSYLKRLIGTEGSGVIFICPKERIISLWDKTRILAEEAGIHGKMISDYCVDYSGTHMSIISWRKIIAELLLVAAERDPVMVGDLHQLEGFIDKIESEAFVPFNEDDFSVQTARSIDRYYQTVDQVLEVLKAHTELNPSTTGLRASPRWQGYSSYIKLKNYGISVDYIRHMWKQPTSVYTPFWCHIKEIDNGNWVYTERLKAFTASLDSRLVEQHGNEIYYALIPKPYLILEELAVDLADQVLKYIEEYEAMSK